MPPVLLTKRIEFAAAHRYLRPEWDEAKNRAVFGLCYNPPAHGHNYLLEVTVSGEVDRHTGMVINLFDLKRVLLTVIEEFDHRNLNLDMPYFKDQIPTSENLARVLWTRLAAQKDIGTLHAIRLYEDEDLYTDVTAASGLETASVTKRYTFPALRTGHPAPTWDWFVTIHGRIDPLTGMVVDLRMLDRSVQTTMDELCDHHKVENLPTPDFIKSVWERLNTSIHGNTLTKVRLVHNRDLTLEYSG